MEFREFYTTWYSRLKHFAREYVISGDDAEDIVQEVFTDIYEKYDTLTNHTNLIAYTFTAIRNRCIDLLRKRIVEQESARHLQEEHLLTLRMKFNSLEVLDDGLFKDDTLEQVIEQALNTLPEKCRIIFIKHKIEGKNNRK